MIREENGRTFSVRTPDELEALLRKDIDALSPDEKKALLLLIQELRSGTAPGPGSLFQTLREADYKHKPVDMETFVKDPYFLGNTCENIYPKLLEDLKEMFQGDYEEVVLTGSIGYGKTYLGSIGLCRILYEISCMKDPQKSFGLSPGSIIGLVVLSITEKLAMKAAFENVTSKIQASQYFVKYFPFSPTKQEIRFPHKVWVAPRATNDTSALGLNVIAFMLDESNFLPKNRKNSAHEVYSDMAESIYATLKRRIKSRFDRRGRVPGIMFVISSKQTSEDFTAKRVAASLDDPKVFVRDYAIWDVKPDEYFGVRKFPVLVGNEKIPSKLLIEEDAQQLRHNLPEGAVLIDVPEEFRRDFETDLEGSIRDVAGLATVSIRPFIGQRDKIFEAVAEDQRRFKGRKHPFTVTEWCPGEGPSGKLIPERLVHNVQERLPDGQVVTTTRPILSPTALRHARFDVSLRQDATGFCLAHVAGFKDVQRRDAAGNLYRERAPVVVVDFLLRVVPPSGGELMLADNRRLLYELSQMGFSVSKVTLDQFQSVDTIQTLKRNGFNAELLSVDMTTEPYDELRNALYEGRLLFYEYQPLIDELKKLQRNIVGSIRKKAKIDHPSGKGHSKDVSDALAGVVHTLTEASAMQAMPIFQDGVQPEDPWMDEQRRAMVPGAGQNLPLSDYRPASGGVGLPILTNWGGDGWDPTGGDGWENW